MNEIFRKHYLQAMGIELWHARSRADQNSVPQCENVISSNDELLNSSTEINAPSDNPDPNTALLWKNLEQEVAACTACGLCKTRTQTVFGVGNTASHVLIIGEAPGAQEDKQGFPFVGRAGQLLDAMLLSVGLNRQQVYIANILKCRPPNNRDPERTEVEKCTPFLQRQLALIQPKLILAVGRIASHFLLNTDTAMSRLRGKQYSYGDQNTPLLVTFHPAYLLRSPGEKSKAYEDLLMMMNILGKQ